MLGVVPSYQASIGPALNELSLGLQPAEVAAVCMPESICIVQLSFYSAYVISPFLILQALYGVYAKDVHVRMACLNSVKCIPAVANRSLPESIEVSTSIWIALHDPEKV